MKKSNILPIILTAVVLLLIAVAGFLFFKNRNTQEIKYETTTYRDDTAAIIEIQDEEEYKVNNKKALMIQTNYQGYFFVVYEVKLTI